MAHTVLLQRCGAAPCLTASISIFAPLADLTGAARAAGKRLSRPGRR
jgi:hypothetical protein